MTSVCIKVLKQQIQEETPLESASYSSISSISNDIQMLQELYDKLLVVESSAH